MKRMYIHVQVFLVFFIQDENYYLFPSSKHMKVISFSQGELDMALRVLLECYREKPAGHQSDVIER